MNLLFVNEDDKTTEEKATVVGKIKDFTELVTQLLDEYDKGGKLTWHNTIPEDEVWVKVGGDHGGGSFKLTLQIGHLDHTSECPHLRMQTLVCILSFFFGQSSQQVSVCHPFTHRHQLLGSFQQEWFADHLSVRLGSLPHFKGFIVNIP